MDDLHERAVRERLSNANALVSRGAREWRRSGAGSFRRDTHARTRFEGKRVGRPERREQTHFDKHVFVPSRPVRGTGLALGYAWAKQQLLTSCVGVLLSGISQAFVTTTPNGSQLRDTERHKIRAAGTRARGLHGRPVEQNTSASGFGVLLRKRKQWGGSEYRSCPLW